MGSPSLPAHSLPVFGVLTTTVQGEVTGSLAWPNLFLPFIFNGGSEQSGHARLGYRSFPCYRECEVQALLL